ncbi:hypothetical protein D3C72_2172050 [compost metagenome]
MPATSAAASLAMRSVPRRTSETMLTRLSRMFEMERITPPECARRVSMPTSRLPRAILEAIALSSLGSAPSARRSERMINPAINMPRAALSRVMPIMNV